MTTNQDKYRARLISIKSTIIIELQFEHKELPSTFFSFLETDANGNIAHNQTKTAEMTSKARAILGTLQDYSAAGKKINQTINFLNALEDGETFLVSVNENDEFDSESAFMAVFALNNSSEKTALFEDLKSALTNLHAKYNVIAITPDMSIERRALGEYQKDKRRCIYCGKTQSEGATFRNKSHAISESLGNKTIIHFEECDVCNGQFGKTFEIDIANYFLPERISHRISGSNGVPSATLTNGAKIIRGEKGLEIIQWPNGVDIVPDLSNQLRLETTTSYTPSGIYRSFVKYAFAGLPIEFLPANKYEIYNWLTMKNKLERLPKIFFAEFDGYPQNMAPYFVLYVLKETDPTFPNAVIGFHFLNKMYFAAIETDMNDDKIDEINASMDKFIGMYPIHKISQRHKWIDFSSEKSKPVVFEIHYEAIS